MRESPASCRRSSVSMRPQLAIQGTFRLARKSRDSFRHFAARFAAKEAAAKALGTGISRGVSWKEIEVQRQPGGPPTLHLTGRAREIAEQLGIASLSLSLTHSRDMALAVAIAEK